MDNIIYFSGAFRKYSDEQTRRTIYELPQSVHEVFQEFGHYIATIWVHQNEVPESAEALSIFDPVLLIPEYKAYIASGGKVETERGLTLEETWMLSQIFKKEPLICLLNTQQPPQPSNRITRKILLTPDKIIEVLQKAFPVRLNSHDIQGQTQRWGNLSPIYQMLVFDGVSGHCLSLIGIDRRTTSFVYWDPWPGSSLLCRGQNVGNVAAVPCLSGERFWLLTPNDLERVIYAVLLPQTRWANLTGNMQSVASVRSEQPLRKQFSRPPDAEQRFLAFFELCQTRGLLTAQGQNDLVTLYRTNRIFDRSSEGYDTLYYLVKIVIEPREEGVDLKQLLNQILHTLAEPASVHQ